MSRQLRSATSTQGRNMAGARALWRATGMRDSDFGKPIIAVVNSFTEFVPGHVHLRNVGKLVADAIVEAGGVAKEMKRLPSMMVLRWAMVACSTRSPAARSSPTPLNTW